MRVLHFADLHLGLENYGRVDPSTGVNSRLLDFLRCLDTAVDHALAPPDGRPVDLVVFCGDAFRSREPSPTAQVEFAARIRRLRRAGLPVLLLAGNHDLPLFRGRSSALEIFSALEVEGVVVATRPGVHTIRTASGPLQVAALPALRRGELLGDSRGLTEEQRQARESARLAEILAELAAADSPAASPRLLAAHLWVEGGTVGVERSLAPFAEPRVSRTALPGGFDYIALGHLHRFQDLNPGRQPPVVYAGSLDRVDFAEENDPKGFVVADIERGAARYQFVPTPARRFLTLRAAVTEADGTPEVLAALSEAPVAGAVVRVIAEAEFEFSLDQSTLRQALREASWAGPVIREIRRPARETRSPELTERVTDPLAALEVYLKARQTPPEMIVQLRDRAARLVEALEAQERLA